LIDISAVSKKHSRPFFWTKARKEMLRRARLYNKDPKRVLIKEADETLETLAIKDTS